MHACMHTHDLNFAITSAQEICFLKGCDLWDSNHPQLWSPCCLWDANNNTDWEKGEEDTCHVPNAMTYPIEVFYTWRHWQWGGWSGQSAGWLGKTEEKGAAMASLTSLQGLLHARLWVELFACVPWFHLPCGMGRLCSWETQVGRHWIT